MGGRVQLEVLLGMGQRVMRDQGGDVGQLGIFGLEKFAPRRGIEEQIAHRERGPRGRSRVFAHQQLAAGNLHPGARSFLRGTGH
jgi:hypothetical protein